MLDKAVELAFARRNVVYRTEAYCEWEAGAAATLLARMEESSLEPCPIWVGDLRGFPARVFAGWIDVFVAGYPCQPFSGAGLQRGLEDERAMGKDGDGPIAGMLAAIGAIKPGFVFLENVPNSLKYFRSIGRVLERMGYEVAPPLIIAAEDVGASHKRERVFILAKLADYEHGEWWGHGDEGKHTQREAAARGGAAVADTTGSERRRSEPIGSEEGRTTSRRTGKKLAESECESGGAEQLDDSGEREDCAATDGSVSGNEGPELADGESGGQRELRESSGGDGQSDGCDKELENSARSVQWEQRSGRERAVAAMQAMDDSDGSRCDGTQRGIDVRGQQWRKSVSGEGCEAMDDSEGDDGRGEQQSGEPSEDGRARSTGTNPELANSGGEQCGMLSAPGGQPAESFAGTCSETIFAPGPGDGCEWERALSHSPHLAPAIEPEVRVLADGMAYVVDSSRADQLRCTGNGVVAIQGAVAFELLLREFGI